MKNHLTNQEVIPTIESDLFIGHEDAHLAVGIVAVGDNIKPGLEREYAGYTLLRGNVYAKQKQYMPEADLNADGTETDPDDARSVHFVLIENAINDKRVVGAMRIIIKQREDEPLPIEVHYPNAFGDGPAGLSSTEVSRLIGRHEDPKIQNRLKWPLFAAGLQYVDEYGLGPVYGAVEESLQRGLQMTGVAAYALGKAEFIPEFNSKKMPIRVDVARLAEVLEGDRPDLLSAMNSVHTDFVYSGTVARNLQLAEENTAVA